MTSTPSSRLVPMQRANPCTAQLVFKLTSLCWYYRQGFNYVHINHETAATLIRFGTTYEVR